MSKFDFNYMRNDELEVMCYNKNKWTKEESLKKSKIELNTDAELEVFDEYADEYCVIVSYTLEDFLYEDEDRVNLYIEPYFAKHQEQFDFADEIIEEDVIRVSNFEYR